MVESKRRGGALVLIFDYLSPAFLSPYGATWLDTPTFNELAARGFVFDFAWSHAHDLATLYAGYWSGFRYDSMSPFTGSSLEAKSLPEDLHAAGIRTVLVSDEPLLMELPVAQGFDERHLLSFPSPEAPAATVDDTLIAQLLAATWDILHQLGRGDQPYFLWVHLRALGAEWDGPLHLRHQLTDPEDPPAPEWLRPPADELSSVRDADQLWGLRCAYGAQVVALDAALGTFLAAAERLLGTQDWMFIVTAPRAYPLGDHGHVGPNPPHLYSESLHVPLVFYFSDGRFRLGRSSVLTQPADIFHTVFAWWSDVLRADSRVVPVGVFEIMAENQPAESPRVISRGPTDWCVRTDRWFLRTPQDQPGQLFVKPDDRYDVNDVANRCPDVVEQLTLQLPTRTTNNLSDS